MQNGTGVTSLRKVDLTNQKTLSTGYVKTVFAHKATVGQTGINLNSLTTPTEMSANGFSNPTASQLAAANLLFYKNNLTLVSSARGVLQQGLSYVVSGSTQITFLDFTALDGEIFTGTIDYTAATGIKVVDASATPATGTLTAGTQDFNVGQSFQTNKYPSTQAGACLVYLNGVLQFRNANNSSTGTDGNYYEVDNGSGSFSIIRFNVIDPTNDRYVLVVPNGLLSERPDGSMMAVIEALAGQVNSMAAYVAALAGQSSTTVLGSAPTNVDLKTFGDRVLTMETNRARVDQTNTFTAYQNVPGRADGLGPQAGYVGERISSYVTGVAINTVSFSTVTSITLSPGTWDISMSLQVVNAASLTSAPFGIATAPNSNTGHIYGDNALSIYCSSSNASGGSISGIRVTINSNTTYYLTAATAGANTTCNGRITAVRV